ncbi:MAG: hypothetical protein A2W05_02980 [Candidatus Schekmanbacteria bacterium RBG_16_38_10]|uniref:Phospholipid/glycerol acyltransferase domain-containing protein n=1 Tax=Candidatus Schekmanbacteria bacterium RBG_16_38_10 TaxID=1817879 RepID=A0A1F7S1B2_9BACT|nr:MAG: hypothetical protein A2W05_02980 [Candidatus Schekmanbacteria bacterium RBG_16_38_10]
MSIGKNKLIKIFDGIISYILIITTISIAWILFRILNRTKIYGLENIPHKKNLLLLPNHLTMIDSFLVGTSAFYPEVITKPWLIPWSPAAEENFFNNPFLAWLSAKWKAIPVKRGRKDLEVLNRMIEILPEGTMINFPEGTRSRTGKLGNGRPGVGKLIYDAKPTVIPARIYGMDKVLPIGSYFPRIFKKISVVFGKPIDFSSFYSLPDEKETWLSISKKVMESIAELRPEEKHREFSVKASEERNF